MIRSSFSRGEADKLKARLQVSITSTTGKWITLQEPDCFSCAQTSLKIAPKRLLLSRMEAAVEESQLNILTPPARRVRDLPPLRLVWNEKVQDVTGRGMGNNEEDKRCPVLISESL